MNMKVGQELVTTTTAYTAQNKIGEGGAGEVWCVVDQEDGKKYAAKFLDPKKTSADKLKRFKNELMFCQKNTHKNILSVVDHGVLLVKQQKIPFYIMPFYTSTLREMINKGIPVDNILAYFKQIIDGVEAAHLLKVFHRDLKPENILYDATQDCMVVADFGIAHFSEELCYTSVETQRSSRFANFQYAAPEQRAKGINVDYRADIYALGLIFNEMYTKHVPHGSG